GVAVATYGALTDKARVVLPGLVAGEIGLVICTPAIVGLVARLGRLLPVGPRLAVRDGARRRGPAGPAVSPGVCPRAPRGRTSVAGSVAITVYLTAQNGNQQPYGRSLPLGSIVVDANGKDGTPGQTVGTATLTDAVRSVLPGAAVVGYRYLSCPLDRNPGGGG